MLLYGIPGVLSQGCQKASTGGCSVRPFQNVGPDAQKVEESIVLAASFHQPSASTVDPQVVFDVSLDVPGKVGKRNHVLILLSQRACVCVRTFYCLDKVSDARPEYVMDTRSVSQVGQSWKQAKKIPQLFEFDDAAKSSTDDRGLFDPVRASFLVTNMVCAFVFQHVHLRQDVQVLVAILSEEFKNGIVR